MEARGTLARRDPGVIGKESGIGEQPKVSLVRTTCQIRLLMQIEQLHFAVPLLRSKAAV